MKLKKLKNVVAIDIDGGSIKAVVGNAVKDELVIKRMVSCVLPEKVFIDGKILNQAVLEATIKNLLRINKINTKNCFCTFESSQMISREVVVPNSPNANFQDVTKFEMAQHLPVDIKNYGVQSRKIREMETDGKAYLEAYTTAVPKLMIDQMADVINNAGLKPLVLDTHNNAIAKLFEIQGIANDGNIDNKTVAFVEFGYECIYISIFSNGKFKLNRLIPVGSKDMDLKISNFLDLPIEQVVGKKMLVDDISRPRTEVVSEDARLWNVVRSTIESWFDELDKTFRFYGTRNKLNGSMDKIYIYGKLTNINGVADFCQSYFRIPTERLQKFRKIGGHGIDQNQEEFPEYLYALGTLYRR